ncbi:hypothetical protein [Companilactobacillus halodurans]|uniref:DUF5067 domain-containing protein n=1 Tax=Companilactobacillus halodurans TaxID=2584183 RepID=A0A5P0ZXP9_9LACO|nr:hypothetical protein [Companilactobacillus halodurans]MQS75020.1 hypothetical protein [Companilactobacillus halodurans]MQS97873.1 hypothetical protein [Companilactobacillus halodurans]
MTKKLNTLTECNKSENQKDISTKTINKKNYQNELNVKGLTNNSNVDLNPGTVALDENGNSPTQEYEDNLQNSLLPSKTVTGVLIFDIGKDNANPINLEFSNSDFETIGTKTYNIK